MAGLNAESDFGITTNSEFIAEHKFAWKPSEFAMLIGLFVGGTLLAIFVQPIILGLAFAFSAFWLTHVNQTKKKKSILQLFSTPEGLKLYHNGRLIEEASDGKMKLDDVVEVTLTTRDSRDYVAFRGGTNEEGNSPYIKMPIRLLASERFQNVIENFKTNGNVNINSKVYDMIDATKKKGK